MNRPETSQLTVQFKPALEPSKQSNVYNTQNNQSAALSNGDTDRFILRVRTITDAADLLS